MDIVGGDNGSGMSKPGKQGRFAGSGSPYCPDKESRLALYWTFQRFCPEDYAAAGLNKVEAQAGLLVLDG